MTLRFLPLGSEAGLLLLFWKRKLLRPYVALCMYLAVELIAGMILFPLRADSDRLLAVYSVAEPLLWLFQYAMVVELTRKGFFRYTGIRRLTTQVQIGAMVIVAAVIIFAATSQLTELYFVQSLHRAVYVGGLIGLCLLALVVWLVPIHLPRNTVQYLGGCFVLFGGDALLLSLAGEMPTQQENMGLISLILEVAVQIWWAARIRQGGEELSEREPLRIPHERSNNLAEQLERLNDMLRRAQGM